MAASLTLSAMESESGSTIQTFEQHPLKKKVKQTEMGRLEASLAEVDCDLLSGI